MSYTHYLMSSWIFLKVLYWCTLLIWILEKFILLNSWRKLITIFQTWLRTIMVVVIWLQAEVKQTSIMYDPCVSVHVSWDHNCKNMTIYSCDAHTTHLIQFKLLLPADLNTSSLFLIWLFPSNSELPRIPLCLPYFKNVSMA